jgi:hypothetical protein
MFYIGGAAPVVARAQGLQEGERRELDIDLSPFRFSRLTGRVILHGPVGLGDFGSFSLAEPDGDGWEFAINLKPDATGGFAVDVAPGLYRPLGAANSGNNNLLGPELTVAPGEVLARDFHFHAGRPRLRVLGANREPRSGVVIEVRAQGSDWGGRFPYTSDDGSTSTVLAVGTFRLLANGAFSGPCSGAPTATSS